MKTNTPPPSSSDEPKTRKWLSPSLVEHASGGSSADMTPASVAPSTQPSTEHARKPGFFSGHSRRHLSVSAVSLLLVLCLTAAATLYLQSHSFVAVKLANLPSTRSVNDPSLAQRLTKASEQYRIRIVTPDQHIHSYSLAEAGMTPDIAASVRQVQGQHGIMFWRTKQLPLVLTANKAALTTFISEHAVQATTAAVDATVAVHDGSVITTPEKNGSGYALPDAPTAVQATANRLSATPLTLKKGTIAPLITEGSLGVKKQRLTKIISQTMTFTVRGTKHQASPTDIANWLDITPVPAAGTVDITVNSGKVAAYIESISKDVTATPADQLTDIQDDGSLKIIASSGGKTTIKDETQLVADISHELLHAKGQTKTVAFDEAATKTIKAYAAPKWLLVNTSTKRMYAYENTTLVRTFLVSAGAPATPTVTGSYKIYAKYRSQDMTGSNADGSRYFQPNVEYINYFYQDYAVHGNYWRPTNYFGNINSSHGCVGIVNLDAAWIYDWAPIGTPVVVHT